MRDVSLNSHYKVMFRNANDELSMRNILNRSVCGNIRQCAHEIFADATHNPHSYLILNCHPLAPVELRYITDIFSTDGMTVYNPKTNTIK
jgi:hypothetical protein